MTFIIIEGLDGSGKTTFINHLQKILNKNNYQTQQLQGLGSGTFGKEIRNLFLKSELIHQNTRFFLSIANMIQTYEELIKPNFNEVIILDRWLASTYAYQLYPFKDNTETLQNIFKIILKELFLPSNLLVYLEIDPSIGIERKKQQPFHKLDVIEQKPLSYFNLVKDGYHDYLTNFHQGPILKLSSNDLILNNINKTFQFLKKENLL